MIGRFAILLLAGILSAQPQRPTFEVASIKPNPGCQANGKGGPSAGRLELPCTNLRTLIRIAYGSEDFREGVEAFHAKRPAEFRGS